MSFNSIYSKYRDLDIDAYLSSVTDVQIERAIRSDVLGIEQFLFLLSPRAKNHLEEMAQRARSLTIQYFGKTIQLYTPIYVSSYCENECSYCGFNTKNKIRRKKLTMEEVQKEAEAIAATGLKHILLLAGESRKHAPVSYIKDCIRVLKRYFDSVSIEIYAITEPEYKELIEEGVDGLTIYQEVYDEDVYNKVHLNGPKKDYSFRLDAAERACKSSIRTVNIGSLLGLGPFKKEAFLLGMHAKYLQDRFSETEVSISIPRIQPQVEDFKAPFDVTDKDLVQLVLAARIFLPRVGITLSTRESQSLRENLLPLGITKISAFSTTKVGGHTIKDESCPEVAQFRISDTRDVDSIRDMLLDKGYQPVYKDWMKV